ncbi:MAG: hypothetical protein IKF51_02870 [Solobacterium sp.]|nr:hypothetical protein [Solobacterium sp.]
MTEVMYVLKPLILTIVLECASAWLLGLRNRRDQFLIILVNALTNPLLVLFSMILMYNIGNTYGRVLTFAVLEPVVVYAEYRLYRAYLSPGRRVFLLSLTLNLISVLGGLLWSYLL